MFLLTHNYIAICHLISKYTVIDDFIHNYIAICHLISNRGVNRAGPNAGRARLGPGRFLNCGPGLTWAGRAGPNDFIIC